MYKALQFKLLRDTCPDRLDLFESHLRNALGSLVGGGTVNSAVVHNDNVAVLGDLNVDLKYVCAVFICLNEARKGVFGSLRGVAAVTDDYRCSCIPSVKKICD